MFRRSVRSVSFVAFTTLFSNGLAGAGVMTSPVQLGVSPAGAATMSFPIQVPPGTAGISPSLAITYDSSHGNGIAGIGAGVSGVSVITRCARTRAQDGVLGSINYDGNDAFCLDGQRLFAISGKYGASNTEYRTEMANFSKIVSYDSTTTEIPSGSIMLGVERSPGWFKVWTKSGQILEYGHTVDSSIRVNGRGGHSVPRAWGMNRIQDINGNYLKVTFINDAINGDFYPSRIDYTGNSTTGQEPDNSVRFDYEGRSDLTAMYQGPALLRNVMRLSFVRTYAGADMVREYRLAYGTSPQTFRSALQTVTECDSTSKCLLPTTFKWGEAAGSIVWWNQFFEFTSSPWLREVRRGTPGRMFFPAEYNGDSKTDVLSVEPGFDGSGVQFMVVPSTGAAYKGSTFLTVKNGPAGGLSAGTTLTWLPADINGDAASDVIRPYQVGAAIFVDVYTSSAYDNSFRFQKTNIELSSSSAGRKFLTGDYNGDGKADLISIYNDAGKVAIEAFSTSEVWTLTASGGMRNGPFQSTGTYATDSEWFMSDVDGDGLSDIVNVRPEGGKAVIDVYLSKGGSFSYTTWANSNSQFTASSGKPRNRWFLADVNGDGRSDVIKVFAGANGLSSVEVHVNQGNKFAPELWLDQKGSFTDAQKWYVGDVNGDGRSDLINVFNDAGLATKDVRLSSGNTFQYSRWGTKDGKYADSQTWFVGDPQGQGTVSLVSVNLTEEINLAVDVHASRAPADRINVVDSGLGAEYGINYLPLSNSDVYRAGSPASLIQLTGPVYVVSQISSPSGPYASLRTLYKYTSGSLDRYGRGFLGFETIEQTQLETGIRTVTERRYDWPYSGMVKKVQSYKGTQKLLEMKSTVFGCKDFVRTDDQCTVSPPGISIFPYVKQKTSSAWDLDGTALPTTTTDMLYDDFGNLTEATVTTKHGALEYISKSTTVFKNDTTNWFIGRPTKSTVTRTQP